MEKVKKVKTAIVGCGMISNIYIRNLKKMFYIIDLVAVCDLNRAAAEEKAKLYGVERVLTIDEVASSDEIELVINLTGPVAHYDVLKKMLLAGKHAYTEKMFTTNLEQARELVDLANEKGLYLGVAPDTILGASIQTAKKVIDAGFIGEVSSVQVHINRDQSLNSEVYRFLRNPGGSLPYDVGIYSVGTMLALFGPVKAIRAFGAPAKVHESEYLFASEPGESWQIPGNNLVSATLLFESGVIASVLYDGNTINVERPGMVIYGSEGILEVGDPNNFDSTVKLIREESGECFVPFTHGFNGKNVVDDGQWFDFYGSRGAGVAEMAWALRQGRKEFRCSKEYGLHCMEVLIGMDEAAETGVTYEPKSRFVLKPLKSGYYSTAGGGNGRGDAERSLMEG